MRSKDLALEIAIINLVKISNQSTPPQFTEDGMLIPTGTNVASALAQIALKEIADLIGMEECNAICERYQNDILKNKG